METKKKKAARSLQIYRLLFIFKGLKHCYKGPAPASKSGPMYYGGSLFQGPCACQQIRANVLWRFIVTKALRLPANQGQCTMEVQDLSYRGTGQER